ncbi:hypothetical protein NHQ30_002053 [Ciborinia camelliae]|nr:hypothetical protein NHQ30_002053 [Ciborinia camelliae]
MTTKEVIVHLMRHEEAEHKPRVDGKRRYRNHIRDPDLTAKGRLDCQKFSQNFASESKYISHIWCSPMKRTINTALLSFKDAINRGVKVQAMDLLQNWDSSPNGIGMDRDDLLKQFGGQVDFDKVGEGWNNKSSGRWAEEYGGSIPALKLALRDLRSDIDMVEVVLISHGSILDTLTAHTGRGGWKYNTVRTFLIDDHGEPYQLLDKDALKNFRSNARDTHAIPTSDQHLSKKFEESKFAATANLKASQYSTNVQTVDINFLSKAMMESISTSTKEEILETAKHIEANSDALVKLVEVIGAATQEVETRSTNPSEKIPRTPENSKIPIANMAVKAFHSYSKACNEGTDEGEGDDRKVNG